MQPICNVNATNYQLPHSWIRSTTFNRITESLSKNKFRNHVCQMILFSLYFNKRIKHTRLQELRNTVDSTLRLQSKSPLDDDTWNNSTIES